MSYCINPKPARKIWALLLAAFAPQILWSAPLQAGDTDRQITDSGITIAVKADLLRDKDLEAAALDLETHQGMVSISGFVDNLLAKDRAIRIAETIRGVRGVIDRIRVTPISRPDADIRKDILMALLQDPATESYQVAVSVNDAVATLTGSVGSRAESQLASEVARGIKGVKEVRDNLLVDDIGKRTDEEIAADARARLQWDIWLAGDPVSVRVTRGHVDLTGVVGSALEKARALNDGWVRGATSVDDGEVKVDPDAHKKIPIKAGDNIKTDAEIKQAVRTAFGYDPRVASSSPEITVEDGAVILSGNVGNLKAKMAAEQDARDIAGVLTVDNVLSVRLKNWPSDSQAEKTLRAVLLWDPLLAGCPIEAAVINHTAYLSGLVDTGVEKAEAQDLAARVKGVIAIRNHLKIEPDFAFWSYNWPYVSAAPVEPPPLRSDEQIKKAIERAFFWGPFVHSEDITVTVDGGVAVLTGTVGTWIAYGEADRDARKGGATAVVNKLKIKRGPWF